MFDAPEPLGSGPERDESGPLWRHIARELAGDALAALDRHWIGAVWGASAACWTAGVALDVPGLVVLGQVPVCAAVTALGSRMALDASGGDWRIVWRPPSRWRVGRIREDVVIHRSHTLQHVAGTRLWEEVVVPRVERIASGVCIGPLEVSRRHPEPVMRRVAAVRTGGGRGG